MDRIEKAPIWSHYDSKMELTMGVNLSIKDVPEEQVEILRRRAKSNHRSLQGELRAILDIVTSAPLDMPLSEIFASEKTREQR